LTARVEHLLQELEFFAKVFFAAGSVSTTGLGQHGLPVVLLEPSRKRLERRVDVVLYAFGVCSRVVAVQVLVYIHDEVGSGAIGVLDFVQSSCRARRDECLCTGVSLTGHQDQVVLGAGSTNGGYDGLDGVCPFVDVGNILDPNVSM
jgi:hypothetical protein